MEVEVSENTAGSHAVQYELDHHYVIHGFGGSIVVQARLAQHGLISRVNWDPGPPAWRLHYDTHLSFPELQQLFKDIIARYDIKFSETRE